ncbi:LysE family transporter [Desulfogranum marinum]|uniref:LysE family transporter n=1 Tax=Desulfogranum marinum TaxID=453220 RepID=UPI0029C80988|nr:LysE family transporter [Desulfogranum marinum]
MLFSLITIFSTSFILALSGALMPGPVLTVTVSESTRRGVVAGPLMIFGHGLLELTLVVALLAGLAPFFTRDDVFVVVSLLGGIILLWMACSMIKELPTLQLHDVDNQEQTRSLVLAGILLSLSNPYWFIWWATIGIGYIMYAAKFGFLGIGAFFTGHILADLAWYSLISFGVAKGKRYFSDTFYRRLIFVCAAFLMIFSCYFFYSGLGKGYFILQAHQII